METVRLENLGQGAAAELFQAELDRVVEWERLVGLTAKNGGSTMMCGATDEKNRNTIFDIFNIRKRVEWARKAKNWNQYELFPRDDTCSSAYGLCE